MDALGNIFLLIIFICVFAIPFIVLVKIIRKFIK